MAHLSFEWIKTSISSFLNTDGDRNRTQLQIAID